MTPSPQKPPDVVTADLSTGSLPDQVTRKVAAGARFVGLFGTAAHGPDHDGQTRLTAVLAGDALELVDVTVNEDYPSLSAQVPGAFWYERVVHDMFGVRPIGHPRLDALVLPGPRTADGGEGRPPRPGSGSERQRLVPSEQALPRFLVGEGVFTIPHGPVRSGVVESLEFLVETPGEDIPRLQVRVFAKHRGAEVAFESRDALHGGVYVAERVEGTASVAHALAYCHALENLGDVIVSEEAGLVRLIHAELERIAGHLDVATRLCEAAGLVLAQAKFSHYKEAVQRIRHDLCGNRFGRGVVVPGGVVTPADDLAVLQLDRRLDRLRGALDRDRDLLMVTSSFLDRLRGTGVLTVERATEVGTVGPVGRASGQVNDVRRDRPYDGYRELGLEPATILRTGDVQARLEVRWAEIEQSFALVISSLHRLSSFPLVGSEWVHPMPPVNGRSVASVEGPQGETVYALEVEEGRLIRVWPRTPSFHNLVHFHDVFHTEVLTDFPFVEASFAVSNAGVVM